MILTVIDPLGNETTYTYDALKHPQTVTKAAGTEDESRWVYVYDAAGNVLSETDPRGTFFTTTFTYDKVGRLVSENGPTGTPTSPKSYTVYYEYDAVGNRTKVSDPRSEDYVTTWEYDAASRQIRMIDARGGITLYAYDEVGNRTDIVDARALGDLDSDKYRTTFTWDALNRVIERTDAEGGVTSYEYDAVGNNTRVVAPPSGSSSDAPAVTVTEYDALNRRVALIDAEENRYEWTYDAVGNVLREVDPRTFTGGGTFETVYAYDYLGHLQSKTMSAGLSGNDEIVTARYHHDALGSLRSYEDPRGTFYTTTYDYDHLNRRVASYEPSGTPAHPGPVVETRWTYDAVGNLIAQRPARRLLHHDLHL